MITNRNKRFCSVVCSAKARQKRVDRTCEQCGVVFEIPACWAKRGGGRFCSRACQGRWISENMAGENSPHWKGGLAKRVCEVCGAGFEVFQATVRVGRGRFCGRACSDKMHGKEMQGENHPSWKTRMTFACEQCGKLFQVAPWKAIHRQSRGRFCTSECSDIWRSENQRGENSPHWRGGLLPRQCEVCGEGFSARADRVKRGHGRFCSQACSGKWKETLTGENSPTWRGGISYEPYTPEFNRRLKRAIRERDNHQCQICGAPENGRTHHVHHIDYDKAHSEPENLITLCISCHPRTNGNRAHWQAELQSMMAVSA